MNRLIRGLFLAAASLFGIVALAGAGSAAGQGAITFGIGPAHGSVTDATRGAYFTYELERGKTISDDALVTTSSTAALTLTVYTADAITATGGGTAFAESDQVVSGDKAWVDMDVSSVSVTADKNATIPFRITVPEDAEAGDHVVGLIVQAPPKSGGTGGGMTTVVTERAGVAIVVRVPGDLFEKLTLGNFCFNNANGSNYLEVPVFNEGNILTRGDGTFRLQTKDGQHVFQRPVELQTVMAPGATMVRIFPPQVIPAGEYRASIEIEPVGGTAKATATSEIEIPDKPVNTCLYSSGAGGQPGLNDPASGDNFDIAGGSGDDGGIGGSTLVIGGLLGVVAVLLAGVLALLLLGRRKKPETPAT